MVKSHGGERLGKVTAETVAGVAQRDERKRTIDEASRPQSGEVKTGLRCKAQDEFRGNLFTA